MYVILIFCIYKAAHYGSFGAVSRVLEMNHIDLKKDPFLAAVDFSWTVSTGLEDMQFKIERHESGKMRGSREQVPATVSGELQPLKI